MDDPGCIYWQALRSRAHAMRASAEHLAEIAREREVNLQRRAATLLGTWRIVLDASTRIAGSAEAPSASAATHARPSPHATPATDASITPASVKRATVHWLSDHRARFGRDAGRTTSAARGVPARG